MDRNKNDNNKEKNNVTKKDITKSSKKTDNNKNNTSNKDKSTKKVIRVNEEFSSQNFIHVKKLKRIFITILIIFVLLIGRIGFLQFVDGAHLKELAYNQQTINQIISPKRGNIYDSNGMTLATSVQVDTVTINPKSIKCDNDEETAKLKETVAKGLSEIFELDYNETYEKVTSNSQVETIAKKVSSDKIDALNAWMKENKISVGINVDEDTKRYYPYNNVLSHVLGFCGDDNDGRYGIELEWDSVLTGTPGKIVSSKDGSLSGDEIPNAEESYIAPENGSDLTLTIDFNIQTIVEKYLKQACIDNECSNGGTCIAMNPKTGDIYAMANYPDFDLNNHNTPNEVLAKTYDSLSSEEKNNALFSMWRNKAVSDLYEPGSVFKVITSAVALEEDITEADVPNDFNCVGYEKFTDVNNKVLTINCWRNYNPHGSQTLRQALENSCNPAFMQLGARITAPVLYKYYDAFGLFDTTGVDLPGEANSLFVDLDKVGPVELATMSFGQRLNITPLQMITAISAVANDGVLMKPRIVKQITNSDTGAVTNVDPVEVRQVISEETASTVKSMMESVVVDGTGYRGAVTGYSIGGKTGTSEPIEGSANQDYVASYVAISPVEDTQIVLLLILYGPQNEKNGHQGGQVAGPVVSQMLTEILPILGVPSDEESSQADEDLITVPDIRNKTITEAEKILKEQGFTTKISTSNDKNSTVVVDQVPKPGVQLSKNSIIMLYDADNSVRTSVTVPDLTGKTAAQATSTLKSLNLNISIDGSGTVLSQDTPKDSKVEEGTVIKVHLNSASKDSH